MFKKFYSFIKKSFRHDDYIITNFSPSLGRQVTIEILLPNRFRFFATHPLIIFNDGQDFSALGIKKSLSELYLQDTIKDTIVVGVYCNHDRIYEYGTMETLHYKGYGNKSSNYNNFITKELLPWLYDRYSIDKKQIHIAGFSLGGLSALDIAWHNSEIFHKVGVFSGSLWWRSKEFNPSDPDADRIMVEKIKSSTKREKLEFWFQVGTNDEADDRNNNNVIDSIDDTKDTIEALLALGYRSDAVRYIEVDGGEHNQHTWGKVMPMFLKWAVGKKSK